MTDPNITEAKTLLEAAANEIRDLRRQRDTLAVKADAYDALVKVLRLASPRTEWGAVPDLAWQIDAFLVESTPKEAGE